MRQKLHRAFCKMIKGFPVKRTDRKNDRYLQINCLGYHRPKAPPHCFVLSEFIDN